MKDRYERQLEAVEREMREELGKARKLTDAASEQGRGLEQAELDTVDGYMKTVEVLKGKKAEIEDAIATRQRVEDAGKAIEVEDVKPDPDATPAHRKARSIGEAFTKSDGYKALIDRGLSGKWSSGAVDMEGKALLNSASVGSEDTGLIQPDVQPGILPILFQRLTVADLMAAGSTSSPLVRYMVETVATSGAAGVPESGEKPESALEVDAEDEPVRKIATFLPVTDEMIEDVPQLTSYINGRLSLFVRQEEEAQLLNGAGGDDLEGLIGRIPGANLGLISGAADRNMLDDIYAAITKVRSAFLEPDGIVMHPDDWASVQTMKDDMGRYLGVGPFAGENAERLWGKRVVVTAAIARGTALVGAFSTAAQVFRKGGLSVEASNSHADFFQKNKTAIRAEERLALAVYRPQAFATADLDLVS